MMQYAHTMHVLDAPAQAVLLFPALQDASQTPNHVSTILI